MRTPLRVGLLANPGAGRYALVPEAIRRYQDAFPEHALYAPEGRFFPNEVPGVHTILSRASDSECFLEELSRAVSILVQRCDRLVAFGGDGFFNHICSRLIDESKTLPFTGIGTGTANVGVLTQFDSEELSATLSLETIEPVSPLAIFRDGEPIGYAFHDIVIGDTFLGTVEGSTRNLSAKKWVVDRVLQPVKPKSLSIGEEFRIFCGERPLPMKSATVAQIIVSPIFKGKGFAGKAVSGLLCFSLYYADCFCIALVDRILVEMTTDFPTDGCVIEQYLFREGEALRMEGLSPDHYVIADGNPLCPANGSLRITRSERRVSVLMNPHRFQCF